MSASSPALPSAAGGEVRRFVVIVLLFILVVIAAIGLSGLLERILDASGVVADTGTTGLATSLAFALVAGPIAAVLWWFTWRGLGAPAERGSALWGLYVAGMTTIALIVAVVGLLNAAAAGVSGRWDPTSFSIGVVWTGVWLWHRWMSFHPAKSPTELVGGARILGYVFGIVIGAGAGIQVMASLLGLAIAPDATVSTDTYSAWTPVAVSAVWLVGAVAVWWLHWVHARGAALRTDFAIVMLVLVTGLLAVGMALSGIAAAVYVALRLAVEREIPVVDLLDPLPTAVGLASVGSLLWAYYRLRVRAAPASAGRGSQLVGAGVSLGAAASGIGIVINSVLAAVVAPLAESDSRSLLFVGLSALVVGGPAWWLIWRPRAAVTPELARDTGRRVYLIAVFGISALVAIITLLVIGFQVFEFALAAGNVGSGSGGSVDAPESLLDRVRASLGLLIATTLVGIYHFSVWRGDRSLLPREAARPQTIGSVILVTGGDHEAAAQVVREATGATVTVWRPSDDGSAPPEDLVAALDGVTGSRVLVVAATDGVRVIPLES